MPKGDEHAAILIATSFQALDRALKRNPETLLTDCTVLILFAGFYIEATLNYIFQETKKEDELQKFPRSKEDLSGIDYPGLNDKLLWFYNEFINQNRAKNWKDIRKNINKVKLEEKFPGFAEIYEFRNDICHGVINQSANSLDTAMQLRLKAKDIVTQLYSILIEKGFDVTPIPSYRKALSDLTNTEIKGTSTSSSSS